VQFFKITEKELASGCLEIRVDGELDLAVADQLQDALERAASRNDRVLIALEGCQFIDSTGIATILRAYNEMTADGRRLAVYGPSSQVLRVLSITGLTGNGLVFDSLDLALASQANAVDGGSAS
jgi:anti-anti-sigma factor